MKRLSTSLLVIAFIFISVSLFNPSKVSACSCLARSTEESFQGADFVFHGTVVSVKPANDMADSSRSIATFDVDYSFKGDVGPEVELDSYEDGSASCLQGYFEGDEWILFGSNVDGKLTTNLCAGNIILSTSLYTVDESDKADFFKKLTDLSKSNGSYIDYSDVSVSSNKPASMVLMTVEQPLLIGMGVIFLVGFLGGLVLFTRKR